VAAVQDKRHHLTALVANLEYVARLLVELLRRIAELIPRSVG